MKNPPRYAEGTDVPVERSKAEIEGLLRRHGASGFFASWDDEKAMSVVGFRLAERMFRLEIRTPSVEDAPMRPPGTRTPEPERRQVWRDQEERRRWRAQLLLVKAKLEMIGTGETTVEREFLADMLLPNGQTVGKAMVARIAEAYETGKMPKLGMGVE